MFGNKKDLPYYIADRLYKSGGAIRDTPRLDSEP